jgi:hypothetical protein
VPEGALEGAFRFRRADRPGGTGHVLGHTRYLPRPLSWKKGRVNSELVESGQLKVESELVES